MTRSRTPNGWRLAAAAAVASVAVAAVVTHAPSAGAAPAYYQWRDESGRMTFSDRPPPASVRRASMVRPSDEPARPPQRPAGAPAGSPAQAAGPTAAAPPAVRPDGSPAGAAPPGAADLPASTAAASQPAASAPGEPLRAKAGAAPSLQERELAFRKRRLEQAQAERDAEERRARAERLARACDDARGQLRALESGLRLVQIGPAGEREPVDDAARERRLAAVRQELREHCAGG